MAELKQATKRDSHLDQLMKDFESAVRDVRIDGSDVRIKTCIQKQMNLMEALGRARPGTTKETLGAICEELEIWPHSKMKDALKNMYHFSCDYPGIRHSGTPANSLREIAMLDFIALSVLLMGFAPYLADGLDPEIIYRGVR